MSEWWTYRLSDLLLFAPRTYYRLFELYNAAIWPAQVLAVLLGLVILVLLVRGRAPLRDRGICAVLAACWVWVAVFLFQRYATINWAATYFAAAFAVEALLLGLVGAIGGRVAFRTDGRWPWLIGLGLFVFALVIQPLLGPLLGRPLSQMEIFGVTPDPTVVATLGLLASATGGSRWLLLVVPVLWAAISGATLWTMGAPDALVLPLAAALAVVAVARGAGRQA